MDQFYMSHTMAYMNKKTLENSECKHFWMQILCCMSNMELFYGIIYIIALYCRYFKLYFVVGVTQNPVTSWVFFLQIAYHSDSLIFLKLSFTFISNFWNTSYMQCVSKVFGKLYFLYNSSKHILRMDELSNPSSVTKTISMPWLLRILWARSPTRILRVLAWELSRSCFLSF